MRKTILRCASCDSGLAPPETVGAVAIPCPVCRRHTRAWLFPALYRQNSGAVGQRVIEEGQSSCMNHPRKQAVSVCDGCGKFLCALCAIDWNNEHLCTACIQHRKSSNYEGAYQTSYTHYDSVALVVVLLSLAFLPMFGVGGFLAPVTFYVAWRYWREPWRPVPYHKWWMVLALVLANLIVVVCVGFAVFLFQQAL